MREDTRLGLFGFVFFGSLIAFAIWDSKVTGEKMDSYKKGLVITIGLQAAVDRVSVDKSFNEILSIFGTPEKFRKGKGNKIISPSWHLYYVDYPSYGLKFTFIASSHPVDVNPRMFAMDFSNHTVTVQGIRIGDSKTKVARRIGWPSSGGDALPEHTKHHYADYRKRHLRVAYALDKNKRWIVEEIKITDTDMILTGVNEYSERNKKL